jgi:hypothetical protein
MATKFKKGDNVKLISVIPEGSVQALRMDEDGNFFYMLELTDTDGHTLQRWFDEHQLVAA